MGSPQLDQQSLTAGADREHPTGWRRGQLLFAIGQVRRDGTIQSDESLEKQGRFTQSLLDPPGLIPAAVGRCQTSHQCSRSLAG